VTSKPEGDVLPQLVNTVKVPPYIGSLAAVVVTCVVVVVVVVLVVAVCVVAWVVVAVVCVAALVVVEELVLEHDDNTKAATIKALNPNHAILLRIVFVSFFYLL
jgi:hypothetical protein